MRSYIARELCMTIQHEAKQSVCVALETHILSATFPIQHETPRL
jgi:hypothetical protein